MRAKCSLAGLTMGRETPFLAKISLFRHKIGPAFVFREFWIKNFGSILFLALFLDKTSVLLEHPAYSVKQEKPFYVKIGHVTLRASVRAMRTRTRATVM